MADPKKAPPSVLEIDLVGGVLQQEAEKVLL